MLGVATLPYLESYSSQIIASLSIVVVVFHSFYTRFKTRVRVSHHKLSRKHPGHSCNNVGQRPHPNTNSRILNLSLLLAPTQPTKDGRPLPSDARPELISRVFTLRESKLIVCSLTKVIHFKAIIVYDAAGLGIDGIGGFRFPKTTAEPRAEGPVCK